MSLPLEPGWVPRTLDQGLSWEDWRSRLRAQRIPRTTRDESWKYTRTRLFEWSAGPQTAGKRPVIRVPEPESVRRKAGSGWRALSFRGAFQTAPDLLLPWVGQVALASGRVLQEWNTQAFEDGLLLVIPDGLVIHEPIDILLGIHDPNDPAFDPGTGARRHFPRVLIHLGEGAQASVIERHRWGSEPQPERPGPPGSQLQQINAVTEILLEPGATLTHYLEQTGNATIQAASLSAIQLGPDSHYTGYTFDAATALLRHEHHVVLSGSGSGARLEGLTLAGRGEHHDRQTWIVHARPGTSSHQSFHSIVAGGGMSIYGGQVLMKPGASGCEATQKNHHLLLDPTAQSRSRPSLEIAVDDVRCSHGSTSGALDPDSLFYLRSRGLSETQARHLLTLAFAGGFLEKLPSGTLKTAWHEAVLRILPGME